MKKPITILKQILKEYNYTDNIHQNMFNSYLYHFESSNLYKDFINELNKNNFEIFRVMPFDNNRITVIVKVKNHDS